jgi:hypothetical protein
MASEQTKHRAIEKLHQHWLLLLPPPLRMFLLLFISPPSMA